MLTADQEDFLKKVAQAAKAAAHIYPRMAACEAVVESAWGTSELYKQANNIFGTKQHEHPIFGTFNLPTKEFLHHQWTVVNADWVKYPTLMASFQDRMDTLNRLARAYPHYLRALHALNNEEYVTEVSQSWSTDPDRAKKCIAIYNAHWVLLDTTVA